MTLPLAHVLALTLSIGGVSEEKLAPPSIAPKDLKAQSNDKIQIGAVSGGTLTPPDQCCYVKSGTRVDIEIVDSISSKTANRGDRFRIKLSRPVVQNGVEIIPAGIFGVGEVIDAQAAGFGGKAAELVLSARYIDFHGTQIRIRKFRILASGQNQTALALTAGIVFGAAGFLVKGGEIYIPSGTLTDAIIAEDTRVPESALNK